jgi:hypothetical protein
MMPVMRRPGARGLSALAGAGLAMLSLLGVNAVHAFAAEIPFRDLGADRCFMFSALLSYKTEGGNATELPLELVINNNDDYKKLFDPKIMRQSCAGVDPSEAIPKVDFSKQSVLGLWASGSCAAKDFTKSVWRDDTHRQIIYSVRVIEAAVRCQGPGHESLNLIAIPKIPEGYSVSFETIRE